MRLILVCEIDSARGKLSERVTKMKIGDLRTVEVFFAIKNACCSPQIMKIEVIGRRTAILREMVNPDLERLRTSRIGKLINDQPTNLFLLKTNTMPKIKNGSDTNPKGEISIV